MAYQTEAALRAALAGPLQSAVNTVTDKVLWQGTQINLKTVYSAGNRGYVRTYKFLDAWITKAGGGSGIASGSYEYDPSPLTPGGTPPFNYPYGGQHQSVLYGTPSAGSVADYIYLGHGGIWTGKSRNAFKQLEQWLKGAIVNLFLRGCKSSGLTVTVVGGYSASGLQ